jgi:hypothetical protein
VGRASGEPVLAEVGPPIMLSLDVAGYRSVLRTQDRALRIGALCLCLGSSSCGTTAPAPRDATPGANPTAAAVTLAEENGALAVELRQIISRYEPPDWRCTQFGFDMHDLARRADAHAPEVVRMVERGVVGVDQEDVDLLIYLMGEKANRLKPALLPLTQRPEAAVRNRARSALKAIERGSARNNNRE